MSCHPIYFLQGNSEEQNIHTRKGLELLARTLGAARRGLRFSNHNPPVWKFQSFLQMPPHP